MPISQKVWKAATYTETTQPNKDRNRDKLPSTPGKRVTIDTKAHTNRRFRSRCRGRESPPTPSCTSPRPIRYARPILTTIWWILGMSPTTTVQTIIGRPASRTYPSPIIITTILWARGKKATKSQVKIRVISIRTQTSTQIAKITILLMGPLWIRQRTKTTV